MARSIIPIILGGAGLAAVGAALAAAANGGSSTSVSSTPIAKPSGKVTPLEAANLLLMYLSGGAVAWGSKDAPNTIIGGAQADMGEILADGIYGPKTKARGEALTGKQWPSRPSAAPAAKPAAAKPAAAKKPAAAPAASSSIPSNKVQVSTATGAPKGDQAMREYAMAHAIDVPTQGPTLNNPGVMTPNPPPGATVVPTERSPKDAAQALYTYATQLVRSGRGAELGTKDKPNNTVAAAQRDMRKIASDGIYGPKTQARGKELLGMEFPSRYGTGTKIASKPPVPQLTAANQQQRAAEGLLAYLQSKGADQGSKGSPSAMVRAAQQQMGGLVADGIYGPATSKRGTQLINKPFPPRK